MRLFRLRNTARAAWWMVSSTLEEAQARSVQCGYVKTAANAHLVADQTDYYLARPGGESLQLLLSARFSGPAYIEVNGGVRTWKANARDETARGNCYEKSAEFFMDMVTAAPDVAPLLRLCHGIVTQSVPPHARMGHAWVEVYKAGKIYARDALYPLSFTPREVYYRVGKIEPEDVVMYDAAQVRENLLKYDMYGPWDAKISAAAHTHD